MTSFSEQVYTALRRVPAGNITTYKDLAQAVGTRNYRAVGQALKRNPDAPATPCHRVVKTDGSIGGFMGEVSGPEVERKIALLEKEGVKVKDGMIVDFKMKTHTFR